MSHFPFSKEGYKRLGPNISSVIPKVQECQFERRKQLAGFPLDIDMPMRWLWIVNELKAEINRIRKEKEFEVIAKLVITIYGLTDLQKLAIDLEWKYLYEECGLMGMKFGKGVTDSNSSIPLAEIVQGRLSDEPVPIKIVFYSQENNTNKTHSIKA